MVVREELSGVTSGMGWSYGGGEESKGNVMQWGFVVFLVFLSACTETIYMKNSATGQMATCGHHPLIFPIYATIAAAHDQDCVGNYKEQGFVRVPGPN